MISGKFKNWHSPSAVLRYLSVDSRLLTSILPKNHAGPVEKVISDFFRMPKKVGVIDSL